MSAVPATKPDVSVPAAWPEAARLLARWLDRRERIDVLLDSLPRPRAGPARARCQHLVLGVVRHFGRIESAINRRVAHPPRFATRAILFIAGFELLEAIGDILTLEVRANRGLSVRREVILGWFGRLVPRALAPSESPCGQRGLVSFAGEGRVLVASA